MDTIGFSGFNSAIQAVECGLPIVTREGRFMRERFGSGILRAFGLPELIAESDDDYVELPSRLGGDPALRSSVRNPIPGSQAALFNNREPLVDLQNFLARVNQ